MHSTEPAEKKHQLPPLDYGYDALEPYIDARTMTLHHDIHHGGYVEKLNAALEKFPEFQNASALWLLCNLDKLPKEIRVAVHHNAGGHVNHSLFWRAMKPGSATKPEGLLRDALNRDFGSIEAFKTRFEEEGAKVFGCGWVWLVRTKGEEGKLDVVTTLGHDNPMMKDKFPLLLNDVWEHAYYLHYESRRPEYLKAWWSIVDWEEASHRFELAKNLNEEMSEAEGGVVSVM
ncbi:MAG: superoxide dismutase [Methylococcaceae bacterium]|nr:superoxide dismutase [Methylococcaceae bacterium]